MVAHVTAIERILVALSLQALQNQSMDVGKSIYGRSVVYVTAADLARARVKNAREALRSEAEAAGVRCSEAEWQSWLAKRVAS